MQSTPKCEGGVKAERYRVGVGVWGGRYEVGGVGVGGGMR